MSLKLPCTFFVAEKQEMSERKLVLCFDHQNRIVNNFSITHLDALEAKLKVASS